MDATEFESAVRAMIANGYSPLPIAHGQKYPGHVAANGVPQNMSGWQRWGREPPNEYTIAAWLRMTGERESGIGVALGRSLVCIDVDSDDCVNAVQNALPVAVVSKRAAKGISLFFRGDTAIIRSMPFDAVGGGRLVDLLSTGRQSVLPNSLHPAGMFYEWVSEDTLFDTPIDHLTELPNDVVERLAKALAPFGYDPTTERPPSQRAPTTTATRSAVGASNLWREMNESALAHIPLWAPKLNLYRGRPARGGYEAVATWRKSGTGQPLERRKRNLSISPRGIEDFGTGEKFTAIDVVMRAHYCDKFAAYDWLAEHLPREPMINLRNRKH